MQRAREPVAYRNNYSVDVGAKNSLRTTCKCQSSPFLAHLARQYVYAWTDMPGMKEKRPLRRAEGKKTGIMDEYITERRVTHFFQPFNK